MISCLSLLVSLFSIYGSLLTTFQPMNKNKLKVLSLFGRRRGGLTIENNDVVMMFDVCFLGAIFLSNIVKLLHMYVQSLNNVEN